MLGVRTGSTAYPGAAVLGVEAAWRTGVGMVRYVGPDRAADLVLARRPETVTGEGRVQAWVIGSGTDAAAREAAETDALQALLAGEAPVVVDAGALDLAPGAAAPVLVTPHEREHTRLRDALGLAPRRDRIGAARETAAALGGCVLLKGSRTVVATPSGWSTTLPAASAWLATAGTGDVLAGVVGAVVAAAAARGAVDADELGPLAATGSWLHAQAAARAVAAAEGGPVTALDVAEQLPAAVGALLRRG
ncbi:ADP/ATP-dependent (S)-NAD(P)H-hydrate dehydratase [Microbacterium sp. T2.11-28]|uniref:ADP-dependent NAD(P)H-hydrate dehydratase n=1 Tax=Microbacterium sp. T2.11-28 TaxID=3041169 RepID=UPI0031451FF3